MRDEAHGETLSMAWRFSPTRRICDRADTALRRRGKASRNLCTHISLPQFQSQALRTRHEQTISSILQLSLASCSKL